MCLPPAVANFLENNVGGDIECVLGRAETVSNEAIALLDDPNIQTNATASSLVNDIIAAVVDFENPLNGTTDGVLAAINDGADSIRDAASSASDWTNEAGDQMEVFIYTYVHKHALVCMHTHTHTHTHTKVKTMPSNMMTLSVSFHVAGHTIV